MDPYKKYVLTTSTYGVIALLGIISAILFLIQGRWFLFIISLGIIYVGLDNFFCSDRCKVIGIKPKSHYTLPPFLRRK